MRIPISKSIIAAAFILIFLFQLSTLLRFNSNLDEGLVLSSAMKAAKGQVMYRDFFEFWSPGAVYLLAGIIKLYGPTWWVIHLVGVITNWLILLLYYIVSRKLLSVKASLALVIFYAYIMLCSPGVNHHWFATVFLLASMLSIEKLLVSHTAPLKNYVIISGLAAGLAACFMQYEGFVAVAGGVVAIIRLSRQKWTDIGIFLLSAAVPALIIAIYFAAQHAVMAAMYSAVIFPFTQYHNVNGRVPDVFWIMQACLIMMAWWRLKQLGRLGSYQKWLLIYTGFMQIASGAASSYHGIITSYLANAFIVVAFIRPSSITGASLNSLMSKAIQIAQKPLVQFLPALMSVVFLVGYVAISLTIPGMTYASLINANQPVQTPSGLVYADNVHVARITVLSHFFSQHHVKDGQVYFGPYSSQYFFFFRLTNPISYSQITPRYNPGWMLLNAARQLDTQKVAYVVLLPQESPFRFDLNNPFSQYVKAHYHVVQVLPTLHSDLNPSQNLPDAIWQRNNVGP